MEKGIETFAYTGLGKSLCVWKDVCEVHMRRFICIEQTKFFPITDKSINEKVSYSTFSDSIK